MSITALLPMKGHSERVSNKNIRLFNGEPLFYLVAKTLQESSLVKSIIINTDSKKIADDAMGNFSKVRVLERPLALCGDSIPMNSIIAHDLSVCDGEYFLQTHSTNPLLKVETIDRAITLFFSSLDQYDSLFSVTRLRTRLYWESGKPVNHNPQELLRTQDLPPLFEENSNVYIFSKESFAAAGNNRIGRKPQMFVMDKLEALDIDEEDDFILAETLYRTQGWVKEG
jgi:CMP-N-acetylneuraminic acid synthetase